jgi:hypothetical protein
LYFYYFFHFLQKIYRNNYYERTIESKSEWWKYGGLRGLGEKQKEEKTKTQSRILSLLEIAPFTYEQLQRISAIHRNTLRKSLNELILEDIIIEHKYRFEYSSKQRREYKQLPLTHTTLNKHNYYLLNYRNNKKIKYYLDNYYNNSIILTKERIKKYEYIRKINLNKRVIPYKIKVKEIDKVKKKNKLYEKQRKKQIDLVKSKIRPGLDFISSLDLKYWKMLQNIVKNQSKSTLDIIIRFSIDYSIAINEDSLLNPSNPDELYFPMLNYKTAWYFLMYYIHLI